MICACPVPDRPSEHPYAYALLSWVLFHRYGLSGRLALVRTAGGKPYLRDFPDLYFSVSHCAGMAACSVDCVETGVDVERIRPYHPQALRRSLAPQEQEQVLQSRIADEMFFRFWTLKESYGKALGRGLAYPLREVQFSLDGTPTCSAPGVSFAQNLLPGGFILSVCRRGPAQKQEVVFFRRLPERTGGIFYEDGSADQSEGSD